MFSKKILSAMIAVALLCAAIVGIIFTGADAGGTSYTWYIDGVGEGDYYYADIDTAMKDAVARDWEEGDTLTIYVTVSGTATNFNTKSTTGQIDTGRNLFSVGTAFRADNTKLPIEINGDNPATTDTVEKNNILLGNDPVWSLSGKKSFAATNDYTFKNLDLSTWAATTHYFYAGSGMVTFDSVNLGASTSTAQTMTLSASVGGWTALVNWTEDNWVACKGEDGLLVTGFSFKNTNYGAKTGILSCRATNSGITKDGNTTLGGLLVKTNMMKNKLILGEGCTIANVHHHSDKDIKSDGFQPAESIIEVDGASVGFVYSVRSDYVGMGKKITTTVKSGSVDHLRMGPNAANGVYTGDMEVNWTGGTISELWSAYLGTINGNVTLNAENVTLNAADGKIVGSTVNGTVTQNIKDCTFTGEVYLGANGKATNVINNLSGTINTDDYYAYLGANSQTITGNLTNNIDCKWVYTGDKGEKHLFCGSFTGAVNGKITNTFGENANIPTSLYGGSRQGDVGSIENTFNGGTFTGNVFGGNRESGTIGSVTTTVNGGTFTTTSYLADRGATLIDTANVTVNGGTFEGNIFLGSNIGKIGTLNALVTGGTFKKNLNSGSASGSVTNLTFKIQPTADKLALLSAVSECDEFVSSGAIVKIGSGTSIIAKKASGSVTFHQTKAWNYNTYFDAAEGTIEITVTQEKGVTGKYKLQGNTLTGITEMLYGASFLFNDRVQLVFHFVKSAVDGVDDSSFVFNVTVGERNIKAATISDIKKNTSSDGKYYTVTTEPLKASEMAHTITYEANLVPQNSVSLLDLAKLGAEMAAAQKNEVLENLYLSYANYAVSVRNYQTKGLDIPAWTLPAEGVSLEAPDFTPEKGPLKLVDSPAVTFYGRSLVLDEGIRLRYYGKGPSNLSSYTLYVNNQKIEGGLTYVSGQTYPVRIEAPISVTEGLTRLRVTIKDADGKVHFDYIERLDRLAYELTLMGEEELGTQCQYYFNSAVSYEEDVRTKKALAVKLPSGFTVGYGTQDSTPYGTAVTISDTSKGVDTSEPIFVTCVALSDGNPDNTVLYLSIPARKVPDNFCKGATEFLVEKTGVKAENIFFNATHSHSAPNITAGMGSLGIKIWYEEYLYPAVVESAQEALMDLAPATAYIGSKNANPGTASVRRYFKSDGTFKSIMGNVLNPIVDTSKAGTYESEIDRAVRTIEFKREGKKPVLLINWQCHAASAVGYLRVDPVAAAVSDHDVDDAYISADFVYYIISDLEKEGYLGIFMNGGSGDINCADNLDKENVAALKTKWNTTQIHYAVGKDVAITAKEAAASGVKVNTGSTITATSIQEEVTVRKDPSARVDAARLCNASFGSVEELEMVYNMYGFDSGLEITHMIKRNDKLGKTDEIPLSVVTFGDLAFAFAPFELFHETATEVRNGVSSLYKMTFVCGYTNGDDGYMPTTKAFKNEGYEHYACFYIDGTAEQCSAKLVQMIKDQTK